MSDLYLSDQGFIYAIIYYLVILEEKMILKLKNSTTHYLIRHTVLVLEFMNTFEITQVLNKIITLNQNQIIHSAF